MDVNSIRQFYPAITGYKIPSGESTASKSPIGSGQQDAGHKGVATGRCELSLCSANQFWGRIPH